MRNYSNCIRTGTWHISDIIYCHAIESQNGRKTWHEFTHCLTNCINWNQGGVHMNGSFHTIFWFRCNISEEKALKLHYAKVPPWTWKQVTHFLWESNNQYFFWEKVKKNGEVDTNHTQDILHMLCVKLCVSGRIFIFISLPLKKRKERRKSKRKRIWTWISISDQRIGSKKH